MADIILFSKYRPAGLLKSQAADWKAIVGVCTQPRSKLGDIAFFVQYYIQHHSRRTILH